ncbi:hypothetical protein GGF32_008526 [Allomyces javanicus]|nr:hypothetical protein GGF32_008526 [Allomyces javanicus]
MAAATAPSPAPAARSPDAPHKAVRDLAAAARLLLTALVDDSETDDPDDALNRQYAAVVRSFHAAIAALRTAKVDVSAWRTFPDNLRAALEAVVGGHDEDDEEAEAVSGAHLHALLTTTVRAMHDALQAAVDGNDSATPRSRATSPRAAAPPPLAPSTPDPASPDPTATAAAAAAAQALHQLRLDLVTILSTLPGDTPLPTPVASHLASIRMHIDSVLPPPSAADLPPTAPASPTTAARDHVTLAHRRVASDLASLADRVDDMAALVDALRHDMVTRGAVPAHAVLAYARAEHASVLAAVEATRASVARERPTWKAVWEAELHRVVEEQEFLDSAVEQANSVADRAAQAEAVVAQLVRVAELADKHPRAVLPRRASSASASLGFPEEDDDEAGLATVLHELATVLDADTAAAASPRRVRAALRTERVRAWARQFHRPTSAFGGELRAFLGLPADDEGVGGEGAMSPGGGTRLRATGGVEAVERARAERDRAVLAALAKGGAT